MTEPKLIPIVDMTGVDEGTGFVIGTGRGKQRDTATTTGGKSNSGRDINFVRLDGDTFALVVDHVKRGLNAFKLVEDAWVEVDNITDPFYNGGIIQGAKPEDYPPLPDAH